MREDFEVNYTVVADNTIALTLDAQTLSELVDLDQFDGVPIRNSSLPRQLSAFCTEPLKADQYGHVLIPGSTVFHVVRSECERGEWARVGQALRLGLEVEFLVCIYHGLPLGELESIEESMANH